MPSNAARSLQRVQIDGVVFVVVVLPLSFGTCHLKMCLKLRHPRGAKGTKLMAVMKPVD